MTKPTATVEQPRLPRAVCEAPCVLLSQHPGKCIQSNGKYVKR